MDPENLIDCIRKLSRPLEPLPTGAAAKLPRLPEVRAVLFDVYGTLFISASGDVGTATAMDRAAAVREALRATGVDPVSPEAGSRGSELLMAAVAASRQGQRAQGIPFPEVEIRDLWRGVLAALHEADVISVGPDAVDVERLAVEYEGRVNPVWPMPGMSDVFGALRELGLPLGIVSNAQFFTPLIFEALLDTSADRLGFRPELCAWSYACRVAKPGTDIFGIVLEPLRRAGLTPEQVLYVGNDMRNDIWPAARCGLQTALFAGDRRSLRLRAADPDCAGLVPDVVVTDLRQLAEVIS
jgi:putative hydrolase of the HAD superfamily